MSGPLGGSSPVTPDVIGRAAELEAVGRFLEDARSGLAGLVVDGEAGIGKTSIWRAAVERARDGGFRILRSAPAESERGLALGGLTDLFAEVSDADLAVLPAVQRHAIEIAVLRAEPSGQLPDQRVLSVAATTLLRALAAERPLLIAIDDAQWLDDGERVDPRLRGASSGRPAGGAAARGSRHAGGRRPRARGRCRGSATGTTARRAAAPRRAPSAVPGPARPVVPAPRPRRGSRRRRAAIRSTPSRSPGRSPRPTRTSHPVNACPFPRRSAPWSRRGSRRCHRRPATRSCSPRLRSSPRSRPCGAPIRRSPARWMQRSRPASRAVDRGTIRFSHPLLAQAVVATASPADRRRAHATLARTAASDEAGPATSPGHRTAATSRSPRHWNRPRLRLGTAARRSTPPPCTSAPPRSRRPTALIGRRTAACSPPRPCSSTSPRSSRPTRSSSAAIAAAPPGPPRAEALSLRAHRPLLPRPDARRGPARRAGDDRGRRRPDPPGNGPRSRSVPGHAGRPRAGQQDRDRRAGTARGPGQAHPRARRPGAPPIRTCWQTCCSSTPAPSWASSAGSGPTRSSGARR